MRNLQLLDHIFFLALIACVALSTTATLAQQKSTSGNIVGLAFVDLQSDKNSFSEGDLIEFNATGIA